MQFKTVLIILFIFFVGFFTGGFSMGHYIKYKVDQTRQHPGEKFKKHIQKAIQPSAEQRKAIRPVFREYMQGFKDMKDAHRKEVDTYMEGLPNQLEPYLDTDQKERLRQELEEAKKKWHRKKPRRSKPKKP